MPKPKTQTRRMKRASEVGKTSGEVQRMRETTAHGRKYVKADREKAPTYTHKGTTYHRVKDERGEFYATENQQDYDKKKAAYELAKKAALRNSGANPTSGPDTHAPGGAARAPWRTNPDPTPSRRGSRARRPGRW